MTSLLSRRTARRGFTLIELLLVIGIIAILAAIVIVAINPTKQLGDTRNAARKIDTSTILNAVWQYVIDKGSLPTSITTTPRPICQADYDPTTCLSAINGVNLRMLSGTYIVSIPKDPLVTTTGTGTRYNISKDSSGRVTVSAPGAEQGATISASR